MPTDKDTIDAYSNYAQKWAARAQRGERIAHTYLEQPAMDSRIPDLKGKSVLAVGCGTGEECGHLKSLGASSVVGIDASEGLIACAKENYPDIEFHVMDMEHIELNTKFDFVYSSLVLHYVKSWQQTLNSISAVMKDDASFLFSTHHPASRGAERTRTEDEEVVRLGYRKLKEEQKCEVSGDYLNTRKINDIWFGDLHVSYYHRPLESIIRDILESGFRIVDFAEPKAVPEAKEKDELFYKIHRKIPLFMIFVLRKHTADA